MMAKLPCTLMYDDDVGKLFKTSRFHCQCSYAIYLTLAWKLTYELLSLQAKILRPPPSPLSLHCKDRKFSPDFDSIPKESDQKFR